MKKTIVLTIILTMLLTFTAYASGDSGDKPLNIDISIPEDGASEIPVDKEIQLDFSNNVANEKVREINMENIKLIDGSGNEVEVNIEIADDQLYPDLKRTIKLIPVENLKEGTTYQVVIGPEVQAKNGNAIGEEITLSFTTVGGSTNTILYAGLGLILIAFVVYFIKRKK